MKKGLVRILCGIVAVQLVLSHGIHSVKAEEMSDLVTEESSNEEASEQPAENTQQSDENESGEIPETQEVESQEQAEEETVVKGSSITVTLNHASNVKSEQIFHISLKGTSLKKEIVLNPEKDILEKSVVFDNLNDGTYVLQIESSGFANYKQEIVTEGYDYSVHIATGEGLEAGTGSMPYGDLNKDGIVNKEDATAVVDALENNSSDKIYDVNKDGKVNLSDLEAAVKMFYDVSHSVKPAKIVKNINLDSVKVSVPESTVQEGNIEELLNGNGSVSLTPSEGTVISDENPVGLSFDFMTEDKTVDLEGFVLETPVENRIASGTIEIIYIEDGQEMTGIVSIGKIRSGNAGKVIGTAETEANGQMTIKLNGQIAVKKITITITSMTQKNASLAEITKVEFINNMEDHIPAPTLDIPEVISVEAGNKTIFAKWKSVSNITGYQILITLDGYTEYVNTKDTSIEISMFRNKTLENKKTYTVAVQAVNGEWKSGYQKVYSATPKYNTIPDAPDSLKLTSNYRMIQASWTAPKDNSADSYILYYKKKGEEKFQKITEILSTNYTLHELEDEEEYILYVTAVNEYGEGPKSLQASIQTKSMKPVTFSQYKIINGATGEGKLTDHIKSATKRKDVSMYNSPLDEGSSTSAIGIVDNDFESYYQINDWDDAVSYHTGNEGWGLTIELDQTYKMDRFCIAAPDDSMYYTAAAVYYWKDGVKSKADGLSLQRKTDVNGRAFYEIVLSNPVETNKIQFGLQVNYYGIQKIQVAEIRLYEYDSLADDIRALYSDNFYLKLRDDVKESDFTRLQERIDTKVNGDYHPERKALQAELDAAKQLFKEQNSLNDVVKISTEISASYDKNLKVSGLNAWQPLGIAAQANEEVIVYVGSENAKQGTASKLQLVVTQQHGEHDQLSKTISLNVGRNVITVPQIVSTDVEKGGALYIQYIGNNANDQYAVRVNGGRKIPVLNLYGIEKEDRGKMIQKYIEDLKEYCEGLKENHEKDHSKKFLFFSLESYDEKTCIYNTTDIMMDHMMISVPATQILSGLGKENQIEKMTSTVDAMDQMMVLFYQHKGLTDRFQDNIDVATIQNNHIPSQHLNIRYMKMFSGAFMYAGGNHIGVEWDSSKELVLEKMPMIDENGRLKEGSYFGWGIAHEIGHQINQSEYAIAEVTNNYFAVLAQADGTNESVRFSYDDVYKKVTSNTTGYPSNVFTQLGMYWQLHLAYDSEFAQKTYDDYQKIFSNLLFARVDTYARNPEVFNNGDIKEKLILSNNKDQNLMRLVSAAAGKDLTEFFERWGYAPDESTRRFMSQFEKEERAIYYINDDARTAVLENHAKSFENQQIISNIKITTDQSDVTLHITTDGVEAEQILGYEIVRVTTQKGQVQKETVGFTTENTFTDSITIGSRAVSYEVYPIDLMTHRAMAKTTDTVKVVSDGSFDKAHFTVSTNMKSDLDHADESTEQDPCEPEKESAIKMILDRNKEKEYIGKAEKDPYILIDLKQTLGVSALRYYAGSHEITDYVIEVSKNGTDFTTASEGTFHLKNMQETVYFTNGTDPWVATYDIRYIRITAKEQAGKNIGIAEIDVLGPSGDNIEFTNEQGNITIGKLSKDYVYDKESGQKIPEGSIVFAGSYKGNPAYNVIALYDQDGDIVGGTNENGDLTASQIILAPDPENAMLGDVSKGIWIYWIEPDQNFANPSQVKAELYRVDNSLTNEGERLTSDTIFIDLPDQFEEIEIEE